MEDGRGSRHARPARGRAEPRALAVAATLAVLLHAPAPACCQDLEPKAYSASPVGTVFLVVGVARSSGSVLMDPTLPLSDVEARIQAAPLAAGYTFGLFGKLALVSAAVPYTWGDVSGVVGEEARSISRSGLADARAKVSVNLVGNPAVGAREFARRPRATIVGASLTVTAPTGQYDRAKLINLGTNRWGFKPEVGVAVPRGPWDFDGYVGVWLLTDNSDFFPGGRRRSQSAVLAVQGHASYTFRPRLWAALDATWYEGGEATVDEGPPSLPMNNTRVGATLSFPAGRFRSVKIAYSSGVSVRTGTDFHTLSVGVQFLRFTRL